MEVLRATEQPGGKRAIRYTGNSRYATKNENPLIMFVVSKPES